MKILVHRVIARLNTGGPAMHVVHLTKDLEAHGFHTKLVAGAITDDEGDMTYYADARGVAVTEISGMTRLLSPWGDLRALWQLFRLFRRERPTIVHTHTAKAGTLGRLAAVLARVPVRIHTYHGHVLGGSYFSPLKTEVFRWIERSLARGTRRLVVLTDAQQEQMSNDLRIAPRERFVTIPLGLELSRFGEVDAPACRERLRAELGIPAEALVVGIVGRLVPVKNHELFFEAIAELRGPPTGTLSQVALSRPVEVIVVGAGERSAALKEHASGLGLGVGVHWLGWRDDLPEVLPALDILALTSHDEGTPVAVIEALAAGIPVVSRAVGGVGEILGDGRHGRVVEPAGASAFAQALASVAAAPPSADSLAEGRSWALEMFGRERLAADVAALYRDELTGASGRS